MNNHISSANIGGTRPVTVIAGRHVPLVRDSAHWQRTQTALDRGRIPELLELVSTGAVVPLPPGTLVAIDAARSARLHVRVLGGPDAGAAGWLSQTAVTTA